MTPSSSKLLRLGHVALLYGDQCSIVAAHLPPYASKCEWVCPFYSTSSLEVLGLHSGLYNGPDPPFIAQYVTRVADVWCRSIRSKIGCRWVFSKPPGLWNAPVMECWMRRRYHWSKALSFFCMANVTVHDPLRITGLEWYTHWIDAICYPEWCSTAIYSYKEPSYIPMRLSCVSLFLARCFLCYVLLSLGKWRSQRTPPGSHSLHGGSKLLV